MKKFLIIQLRPETDVADNELTAILNYGGLKYSEIFRIRAEIDGLPDIYLSEYSGILVGGSPFDISKAIEEKSDIQKKIESDFNKLFDEIVRLDFPFLGACSGSGLLGNYCGANISKKYGESISGVDIHLTEEGKIDPILEGISDTFRGLVGHKEACDNIPPGAILLASSDTCKVQMFRVGKNVYATQFHPELNVADIILRIKAYKNSGYFSPKELDSIINNVKNEKISEPHLILKNFVDKYKET